MGKKKKGFKNLYRILILLVLGYLGLLIWHSKGTEWLSSNKNDHFSEDSIPLTRTQSNTLERTEINYGEQIDQCAQELDLPAPYFKALVVLECSGKKEVPSRFEPHVYQALKDVRDGNRRKYFNIRRKSIKNASDDALRNLASSWGPFQIMGYQVLQMNINVNDIRGDKAVLYGMKWSKKRYGRFLKKGRYADAFHIHNTGSPLPRNGQPRTYHKSYIPSGMKYFAYFENLESEE